MSEKPDLPGDLLALAREDLASAEALDKAARVSDSPVGFHAQQAVEKALKAAIASRDLDPASSQSCMRRGQKRSAMGCARNRMGGRRNESTRRRFSGLGWRVLVAFRLEQLLQRLEIPVRLAFVLDDEVDGELQQPV